MTSFESLLNGILNGLFCLNFVSLYFKGGGGAEREEKIMHRDVSTQCFSTVKHYLVGHILVLDSGHKKGS